MLLVTGDAYVDHPSYGTAVIGRTLEAAGLRVGVVAQPDWRNLRDFVRMGRPRFFVGITAGNLDSMVSNYTSHKKIRPRDVYSPGGKAGLRPDRATIVYANRIREAFGSIPIVIGGIEASLRRLAHYDWWDNRVRRSILLDAKADILVYGMGEKQIREVVARLRTGADLGGIPGTVIVRKTVPPDVDGVMIPSCEETANDRRKFGEAFRLITENQDPFRGKALLQKHGDRFVIQFPPPYPLTVKELDSIFAFPYVRSPHPSYQRDGGIPGFETVRFSIISHRGCCGGSSFCSLGMHQGRIIQSRSPESVLDEARLISESKGFKGTITDVGGPTANLYKAQCLRWTASGTCSERHCLIPERCKNLKLGYAAAIRLYKAIMRLPKVRHMFIESGLRYDLLVQEEAMEYLDYVCRNHIGGQMKVAPEHSSARVLRMMNKPGFEVYERFVERFAEARKRSGKDQYIVNYFISSHPGATMEDERHLSAYLRKRLMKPRQVQDFTPLPLTLAACMYHTGEHPITGEKVYSAKTFRERKMHRATIQQLPATFKKEKEFLRGKRKEPRRGP